jgi:hypothetical protein
VALALSPLFVYCSFLAWTDTIATAACAGAVWAALRGHRSGWWAAACGVVFALAVLVRPSNLILAPVLVLLLWNWRSLLLMGLAGLPGAVWQAYYYQRMCGSPFVSGYGPIFDIFKWEYLSKSLHNYALHLVPTLPVAAVAVLLLPLLPWRTRPRQVLACLLWSLLYVGFYAFYEFTHQTWWFLRFIMPAYPAVILLATLGLESVLGRLREGRAAAVRVVAIAAIVGSTLYYQVRMSREHHIMLLKSYQEPYEEMPTWARAHLPANAAILAMQMSSAFFFYTDFPILRWDAMDPPDVAKLSAALRTSGRPLYAVLLGFEYEDERMRRFVGQWTKLFESKGVTVWEVRLAP